MQSNYSSHEFLEQRVIVTLGDITRMEVDAVVNAANATLLGGGGVDGAIHRAGGVAILEACREIRKSRYPAGLPAGHAVITTAGELPARFVIHTVGPVWGQDRHPEQLLASCYRNSIELAATEGLREIAFPAISTGAYAYPKSQAASVASAAIKAALATATAIERVHLVFFSAADADLFVKHQLF